MPQRKTQVYFGTVLIASVPANLRNGLIDLNALFPIVFLLYLKYKQKSYNNKKYYVRQNCTK